MRPRMRTVRSLERVADSPQGNGNFEAQRSRGMRRRGKFPLNRTRKAPGSRIQTRTFGTGSSAKGQRLRPEAFTAMACFSGNRATRLRGKKPSPHALGESADGGYPCRNRDRVPKSPRRRKCFARLRAFLPERIVVRDHFQPRSTIRPVMVKRTWV